MAVSDHGGQTRGLCPRFHFAVELIGRRWTGAILFVLQQGPTRYCDLRTAIEGITDPMLSERLRELEREGIVTRAVLPGTPVGVEYALSPKGKALGKVLKAIGQWSHEWLPSGDADGAPSASRRKTPRVGASRGR
jgi:DNA-binding HxlR family transcriptional regulator